MAIQGTVPVQELVKGDTLKARNFAYAINSVPAVITSATFGVKKGDVQVYGPVSCVVSGDTVTRPAVSDTIISTWPRAVLTWDIRCEVGGAFSTWTKGTFSLLRSEQETA